MQTLYLFTFVVFSLDTDIKNIKNNFRLFPRRMMYQFQKSKQNVHKQNPNICNYLAKALFYN